MTKQKRLIDPKLLSFIAAFTACIITPAVVISIFANRLIPYIENASALHLIKVLGGKGYYSLLD